MESNIRQIELTDGEIEDIIMIMEGHFWEYNVREDDDDYTLLNKLKAYLDKK